MEKLQESERSIANKPPLEAPPFLPMNTKRRRIKTSRKKIGVEV
jgi:hypothetical protein